MTLYLYLLKQDVNDGYDTYDSCIVAAEDASAAHNIHPSGHIKEWTSRLGNTWASHPGEVTAQLIGTAAPNINPGVILASFNAG